MANWTGFRANDKPSKLFEFISGFFAQAFALVRASEPLSLVYTDDDDPDAFIDKRGATMVIIGPIPAAADGLTMTPLVASDAAGTGGVAIPMYLKSDGTYADFPAATVNTGDWVVLQADLAPAPYIGVRFGSAITATVPLWIMG